MLRSLPSTGTISVVRGRSLGELALAEDRGLHDLRHENGKFDPAKPPGLERPRTIEAWLPASRAFAKRWRE